MTTDTQLAPTDAELWQLHMQMPGRHKDPIDFACAVLARWGQPAPRGVPVAWKHDCAALLMNDVELWIDACPHCGKPRNAPQPVEREPLTDEHIKALMRAHRTAMLMTCKARVPECGEFAAIAQDLDWLCESLGIKGGQHGTE